MLGCSSANNPTYFKIEKSDIDIICVSQDLEYGSKLWLIEARKRFINPLIFSGHGTFIPYANNPAEGTWVISRERNNKQEIINVSEIAKSLRYIYPERDIILVVCNPGKVDINVKNVWYARENVWAVPDKNARITSEFKIPELINIEIRETSIDKGYVGNIYEFVTERTKK